MDTLPGQTQYSVMVRVMFKGSELNSATTLTSQPAAGHRLSFITFVMTLGWGMSVVLECRRLQSILAQMPKLTGVPLCAHFLQLEVSFICIYFLKISENTTEFEFPLEIQTRPVIWIHRPNTHPLLRPLTDSNDCPPSLALHASL